MTDYIAPASPRTVAIIGGHGKIALLAARELSASGHTVLSVIRNPDQASDITEAGGRPVVLDIETAEAGELADKIRGTDAIVFAAGAGGDGGADRKKTVDLGGSLKSIDAAKQLGVRRFLQISFQGADDAVVTEGDESWLAYHAAKKEADDALRDSGLDYTIIRPGGLTDEPAGPVETGTDIAKGETSRGSVAAYIAAVIDDEESVGAVVDIVDARG